MNLKEFRELTKDMPDDTVMFTLYHSDYVVEGDVRIGWYDKNEDDDLSSAFQIYELKDSELKDIPEERRIPAIIIWED